MSPISPLRFLAPLSVAAALFLPSLGRSQAQGTDTVYLKTNVGSFKILGVETRPASGKVQVNFTGTMLIDRVSAADPKITVTGNLKKEYDNAKHLQVAYHGTGTMIIEGNFTAIQWFGRDMSAQWTGFGIARLVGEFDKDLKTGSYWYQENVNDIKEWGTQLTEITNPPPPGAIQLIPKGRKGG